MDTDHRDRRFFLFRIYLVTASVLAFAGIILLYLVKFQILSKSPASKHLIIEKLPPKRGEILDRSNFKIAYNHLGYLVYQRSRVPEDQVPILRQYGIRVKNAPGYWKNPKLTLIAYDVSPEVKEKIFKIPGLYFRKAWFRSYTDPEIFEPLVGCVQKISNTGLDGLEFYFDKYLKGTPGRIVYLVANKKDSIKANRIRLPVPDSEIVAPEDGCNLVLTIDQRIQTVAYEEVKKGVLEWHARRGAAIVVNPETGDVLALAVYPSYIPENYSKTSPERKKVWPVTDPYEPGSIFKAITYGAALTRGFSPTYPLDTDGGVIKVGKYRISDVHPLGRITLEDALVHSSNVGTIKLAFKVGKKTLYSYIKRAGIGRKTGVGLPGENPGKIQHFRKWDKTRFANVVIGYGFLLNSFHIVDIYSAIANRGIIRKPRILKSIVCGDTVKNIRIRSLGRLFPVSTCEKLTGILVNVVEKGTGRAARIQGVKIAGKTGTANKLDPRTKKYNRNKRIVSFVGFFPADNPRYLIYVVVDEPYKKGIEAYGGTVAAPIFKRIAEFILAMRP